MSATARRRDTGRARGRKIMSIRKRRGGAASPPEFVAGNGLLDRRALLGSGIAFAGAMGAGGSLTGAAAEPLKDDPWSLEMGTVDAGLSGPVAVREGRRAHAAAIPTTSSAIRTRARRTICCRARSRPTACTSPSSHSGLPDIDPAQHKLVIHGLVKQPLVLHARVAVALSDGDAHALPGVQRQFARRCSPTSRCRRPRRRCTASSPTPNGPACRCRRCWMRPASIRRPNG